MVRTTGQLVYAHHAHVRAPLAARQRHEQREHHAAPARQGHQRQRRLRAAARAHTLRRRRRGRRGRGRRRGRRRGQVQSALACGGASCFRRDTAPCPPAVANRLFVSALTAAMAWPWIERYSVKSDALQGRLGFQSPFPPGVADGLLLKCSKRSDSVTRDRPSALRVAPCKEQDACFPCCGLNGPQVGPIQPSPQLQL